VVNKEKERLITIIRGNFCSPGAKRRGFNFICILLSGGKDAG